MMKKYLLSLATDQRNGIVASIVKAFLQILSWIYLSGIQLRNLFFNIGMARIESVSRPVISIGNITMGGVGKTPLVIRVAQLVLEMGKKPVIVTRGYMAGSNKENASDEVKMIQKKLPNTPVLVGKERALNIVKYLLGN